MSLISPLRGESLPRSCYLLGGTFLSILA